MTITAYPSNPQVDATAMLVFSGPPNVAVSWALVGSGSLAPETEATDGRGIAAAIYTPGTAGDTVMVSVTHGTAD
jgi:hypothetical protein